MINYNTFELTKAALNSIFDYTEGIEYEIVLVDNLSPDGSGEKLRDLFCNRITYLQSGGNLGTSKAFNLGLSKTTGKYVLWLNTDILIKDNFIKKLFDYMESDPTCGICGGNILDFNGKPAHSFRRVFPDLHEEWKDKSLIVATFRKLFRKPFFNQYNYTHCPKRVGYITGADMMIRANLFKQVGGFDTDIFMYSEEVEFTWRVVNQTNMKIMSVPDAHIFHLEGASFGQKNSFNERRFINGLKGSVIMYTKCYGAVVGKKYLKLLRRAYLKFIVITTLLFMRDKRAMYIKKRAIVTEMMSFLKAR